MVRWLTLGAMLFGAVLVTPPAFAQKGAKTATETATEEDPNDKMEHERSFEETRKHMQLHSEWSKKSGKMNDK